MKEAVINGNKLIAEFMELPTWEDGRYGKMYSSPIAEQSVFGDVGLLYDKRWDWLMPVVEKIENGLKWKYSVETNNNLYSSKSISYETVIYDAGNALRLEIPGEGSKILSVWLAVIEFIKWYNLTPQ